MADDQEHDIALRPPADPPAYEERTSQDTRRSFQAVDHDEQLPPRTATGRAKSEKENDEKEWSKKMPMGNGRHATPLALLGDREAWVYCPDAAAIVQTEVKYNYGSMTWVCCCLVCHFAPCLFCFPKTNPLMRPECKDTTHRCSQCKNTIAIKPYDPMAPSNIKIYRSDHQREVHQPGRQEGMTYSIA